MKSSAGDQRQSSHNGPIQLLVPVRLHTSPAVIAPDKNVVRRVAENPHADHATAQHLGPRRNQSVVGILLARRQRSLTTFLPVEMSPNPMLDRLLLFDRNEVRDETEP